MNFIHCRDYDECCRVLSGFYRLEFKDKENQVFGFATGSTPLGLYQRLIEMVKNGDISFEDKITFNLDEYYPIDKDNEQSFTYFMKKNLFEPINFTNYHIPYFEGTNEKYLHNFCKQYSTEISTYGGIDVQLLGVGENGHIGFNEPEESFEASTHVVNLTESTIKANSRFFNSENEVPKKAITMGLKEILNAKKIYVLVTGEKKQEVLMKLLTGKIYTDCPATFLNLHKDTTVIFDDDAYGER